jgi:hypothetical protein
MFRIRKKSAIIKEKKKKNDEKDVLKEECSENK